ncbi:hypothetical protein ONZ45_g4570 [Pleurotus djamor]|nr:hypothetical protein ONZ45_g4570 [Pleurotus djamor]
MDRSWTEEGEALKSKQHLLAYLGSYCPLPLNRGFLKRMKLEVFAGNYEFNMLVKLPMELWTMVISSDELQDRSALLPLQIVSRRLHALVTPIIYRSIAIVYSGSEDFLEWVIANGGGHVRGIEDLFWEPPVPYTTYPHISIRFHRLPNLQATFSSNPLLAAYTSYLVLRPLHWRASSVMGWKHIIKTGWAEIRSILPFFNNIHHMSVCPYVTFPSDVLRSLPNPSRLTHLRILDTGSAEELLSLLPLHPDLQTIAVLCTEQVIIQSLERFYDTAIELPKLNSLETDQGIWGFLARRLSESSLSSLKHFSISTIPTPMLPISTLNNLRSIQIPPEGMSLLTELIRHLHNVEYLSIMGTKLNEVAKIPSLFNIPSVFLKYVYVGLYLPDSGSHNPSPSVLFDRFTELVIVDVDNLSEDDPAFLVRFLRNVKDPAEVYFAGSPELFRSWWEKAEEEVERATRSRNDLKEYERPTLRDSYSLPLGTEASSNALDGKPFELKLSHNTLIVPVSSSAFARARTRFDDDLEELGRAQDELFRSTSI